MIHRFPTNPLASPILTNRQTYTDAGTCTHTHINIIVFTITSPQPCQRRGVSWLAKISHQPPPLLHPTPPRPCVCVTCSPYIACLRAPQPLPCVLSCTLRPQPVPCVLPCIQPVPNLYPISTLCVILYFASPTCTLCVTHIPMDCAHTLIMYRHNVRGGVENPGLT